MDFLIDNITYISIAFICVIWAVWIIYKRKKKGMSKNDIHDKVLKESVDMDNVIYSSFNASALYDKLKKKYHPDRFLDEKQKEKADQLFQQITLYRRDYNKLLELEKIAENELNKKE